MPALLLEHFVAEEMWNTAWETLGGPARAIRMWMCTVHGGDGGGGCTGRHVMYLHHFSPLLALSCQPQVLHSVGGDCIPVRAGRAKASLDVLLHLSHLLLWARLQLHMGRRLSCAPGHSSSICLQAQVSARISEFFVSWK